MGGVCPYFRVTHVRVGVACVIRDATRFGPINATFYVGYSDLFLI
jgi:hypothetical protein